MDIKATLCRIVDKFGSSKAAVNACGARDSEMSWWTLDHHARHIPIDHLMRLDAAAGDVFLREWAESRGFDLTPRKQTIDGPSMIMMIGQLAKETAELSFSVLEAAADNHYDSAEKRRIRNDIAPVKDRIAQLERATA